MKYRHLNVLISLRFDCWYRGRSRCWVASIRCSYFNCSRPSPVSKFLPQSYWRWAETAPL